MTINSVDSLILAVKQLSKTSTPANYLVLGEGSNTVFVEDFNQTVLLNKIKGIEIRDDDKFHYLTVGAGENWHNLVSYCMQKKIGGFENLALIPGTVGAAPIQNIGAYGVEIERFIESVEYLDTASLDIHLINRENCEFAYRDSVFKRQGLNSRIITNVRFKLPKKYTLETTYGPLNNLPSPTAKSLYEHVIAIRKSKLPNVKRLGNAGSFFKNPVIDMSDFEKIRKDYPTIPHYLTNSNKVKIPAAWLIDKLGFKGKQVGEIACYEKQPLVLVNMGNGEGKDLLTLARNIKASVFAHFNIVLENEVRLMGSEGLIVL